MLHLFNRVGRCGLCGAPADADAPGGQGILDDDPNAFVVSQFAPMQNSKKADKMTASVRGIAGERLNIYRFSGAKRLFTMKNRIRFADLRREKTALFLNVSEHSILTMPVEDVLLIRRGEAAKKVKRYTLERVCDKVDAEHLQSRSPQIPEHGI